MLTLYDNADSGNGYKVRLLAALIGVPLEVRWIDIFHGESHTPEFLRKNPCGQIPVLEFPDGQTLSESNAILCHLAEGTSYLPPVGLERSRVLSWLFFEQYSHEPYVATPRYILRHLPPDHPRHGELAWRQSKGRRALELLEQRLAASPFLAGEQPTIADISLFAYTHRAPEGGLSLTDSSSVRAWLERVASLPSFIPMSVDERAQHAVLA